MSLLNTVAYLLGMSLVYLNNYFFNHGFVHVEIDKGILRGRNASTWGGQRYFSFKGIPYARPPIDDLRFKAPQEEAAWAGVRDAVSHGEVCPHVDMAFKVHRGAEDCLFLNVYTPALQAERLPVMVWIHGGMFILGSGNDELYGPNYFVEAGVILVTMNYRLGALGFLSTGDDGVAGNAGLKDQVAALRWVRRNIAKFGGDPENVTIFGGSTGAASVHFHLLSPMLSGLFAKAIGQSGSAVCSWALSSEDGADVTIRLAETLGGKDVAGEMARALEFLKTAPYADILASQETLTAQAASGTTGDFLFAPTVEEGVTSEEVFLPDSPLKILMSGSFNKVPYIIGYTSNEGLFFLNDIQKPDLMKAAFEETERFVPRDIKDEQLRIELGKSIREFYFDDKPIGNENITNFVNFNSDAIFIAGIKRGTKLHLQSTNSSTYFYVFSHDGRMNLLKFFLNIYSPGAVHGDELGYMFHHNLLFSKTLAKGSNDEYVLNAVIRLWTNFAKYGNPTPAGDPLTWKPATVDQFNYLNISGRDTKLAENPDPERAAFWARAYEKDAALRQENFQEL